MSLVLGAFGLFACARQDQASVHAPLVEVGSVRSAEPASPPSEIVSSHQGQEDPKLAGLDHFERWARDNIRFAFSSRTHRSDACFDRSNLEVSCRNPTAARQETKVWDEIASTVVNRSEATLTCETTGSTKETAVLPPKGTHTFSVFTMPRAAEAERETISLRCTMKVEDAVKLGALSATMPQGTAGLEVRYGSQETLRTLLLAEHGR